MMSALRFLACPSRGNGPWIRSPRRHSKKRLGPRPNPTGPGEHRWAGKDRYGQPQLGVPDVLAPDLGLFPHISITVARSGPVSSRFSLGSHGPRIQRIGLRPTWETTSQENGICSPEGVGLQSRAVRRRYRARYRQEASR